MAKNSFLLFLRMFVLMVINLYAVRVLLDKLGDEDYGIFNAVAGVVTTLSCLSSVLSVSTQRFYSFVKGNGNVHELKRIYSASLNINLFFLLLIVVLFETAGYWFLNHYMTIPPERHDAANLLFQFSLFSFVFTFAQIPFTAAIIANEDMGLYALVSTVECVLKLVAALSIGYIAVDQLAFYGCGLWGIAVLVFLSHLFISRRRYSECRYVKVTDRNTYRQLLSFSGWTLFGSLANVGMFQGNTILLNVFFGPLVNAAYGISFQIYNAFNSLCNSIVLAIRPGMIKMYAQGQREQLNKLFFVSNKFILYILLCISVPLILELRTVFSVWLGNYSENMLLFSRIIIVYVIFISLHHPITIIMQATGVVKQYHVWSESISLLCLPLSFLLFYMGFPSYSSYVTMVIVCLFAQVARLLCLKRYYGEISLWDYFIRLVAPGIVIITITTTLAFFVHNSIDNDWLRMVGVAVTSVAVTLACVFAIGLSSEERRYIKSLVISKIGK